MEMDEAIDSTIAVILRFWTSPVGLSVRKGVAVYFYRQTMYLTLLKRPIQW